MGSTWIKLQNFPFGVGFSVGAGVHIRPESGEKVETLNALPPSQWPQHLQAAAALQRALATSISPSQDDLASKPLEIQPTPSGLNTVVLIEVGKKP